MANVKKIVAAIKPSALDKPTKGVIREAVKFFGSRMVDDVDGGSFNIKNKRVTKFLKNYSSRRITGINNTTRSRVASVLEKAVDAGKSNAEIADLLTSKFERWSKGRAFTITDTEIARASNFGAHEGMVQAGIEKKEWLATNDANVRDTHEELNGEVVNVDEPFSSGAMYPGDHGDPAEDVNCRCGVLAVIDDKRMRIVWRVLERQRAPFDRKMRVALQRGFANQLDAALAAIGD